MLKNSEVVIVKGDTPKGCVFKGIDELGGISKFIENNDQVFIKINLNLPNGYPTHTNFDVVCAVITSCRKAGAKKIYVGSFPLKQYSAKLISKSLGLDSFLKNLGAEFAFLDNSDCFKQKHISLESLKKIKEDSFIKININDNKYLIPKVIYNSNKVISVNQINVSPIFKLSLALFSSYSMVPNRSQEIRNNTRGKNDLLLNDRYKKRLVSNVIDVFSIKKPNLVINDLFYLLEGAGPCIYRDSNLKKTNLMVIGNDAVAVDLVTLKITNIDALKNDLIVEAQNRDLGAKEFSNIKILGENIEDINLEVDLCVPKLEQIKVLNFSINSGQYCTGCYEQAYRLLNFMKTVMIKDLKYISKNTFIIGENPSEPESSRENLILFGDCAIQSTLKHNFRKIVKKSKKKIKEKTNKKILELPGCPPDFSTCIKMMIKYFGKRDVPMLYFHDRISQASSRRKIKGLLEQWEAF